MRVVLYSIHYHLSDNKWYIHESDCLLLDKLCHNFVNELHSEHNVRFVRAHYFIASLYYGREQKNNNHTNTNISALGCVEKSLQLVKLCNTLSDEIENKNYSMHKQISKEYLDFFRKRYVVMY